MSALKHTLACTLLILAVLALAAATYHPAAALTRKPATVAWPAVGQSLQYLVGPDAAPQAALITGVPIPPAKPAKATSFPTVGVVVFPPGGASFPATVGYCAEQPYPCLVPLP